jgi:hypothetical protein
MKKLSLIIKSATCLALLFKSVLAQNCFIDNPPTIPPPQGGANQMMAPYDSKNGWWMTATGEVRILFVFYEVNYTGGTDPTPPNGNPGWPAHQLPTWANQIAEAFTPVGTSTKPLTQYFQLASSNNYIVLGDYLLAPNNGGIFSVNSSTGSVGPSQAIASVNAALGTSIVTGNGFNSITDFDKWTIGTATTGPGQPKITPSTENPANKYDHVMFICRNSAGNNGTGYASWALPSNMLGFQANTHSSFGAYDGLPFNIIRHEFSHMIFGDNDFHCGGGGTGNPNNYWIPLESGWSNMSLYNGSLNSWNAWDRLRLDWKAPGSNFGVAARNQSNIAFVNGNLDATVPAQAGIYTLRDFVLFGDALRIKLPFTDPATDFPLFLWIENHQGRNVNGVEFDKWQWEVGNTCVQPVIPGLYAYMQVDKEVRSGASASAVYYGYADYLRPITADGFWDRDFESTQVFNPCVQWGNTNSFIKTLPNPLTGGGDQDFYSYDINNNNVINYNDQYVNFTEKAGGNYFNNLFMLGNSRHAFTLTGNKKIGIGTNPSSASMMNLVSYDYPNPTLGIKNLRKVYLNGISIEILNQTGGNIQVQIRFDDVDINNDARWCGDEIVLNPITSPSGFSMNIKSGKTVTLDQGTTATRMDNPQIFNGKKVFASNTLFRATANTIINMETNSNFIVDNNSILRMESGSALNVANGATIRVKRGGRLELQTGCVINVADGGKIIIEEEAATNNDGWLVYFPNARINLNGINAQLEIAGFLDIQNNATFTTSSSANINVALGSVKFSSTDVPSQNILAGTGCKFIIQSNAKARKILYVNQETLYGPNNLTEFTLQSGTAVMAPNARIQPPISNSCVIKFNNAQVTTANNVRNSHRGVRLNGQALVTLTNSNFSKGYYGLYSYNTTLGNGLTMSGCQFIDCDYGLYSYDKNVNMTNCSQQYCTVGWYAEQMASTSNYTTSNAKFNTQNGIYYQGVSTLNVNDPLIDNNLTGLTGEQASVYVKCGSVSTNSQYGMYMKNSATLFMNGSTGAPHDPTTALNNGTTIKCLKATNLYLNLGINSLKPLNTGQQKTLNGTLLCQTYSAQPANQNNWNGSVGTALTSAEYSIATSCVVPTNVVFTDPSSVAQVQCGQAIPPCNPPCNMAMMDPISNCPTCDVINTPDYPNTKLNDASMDAKATAEDDNLADNEKIAIDKYNQILMEPLQNIDIKEDYILNYDYQRMKESFSDALAKYQLYPDVGTAPIDQYMQMLLDVQDKIIDQAISKGNYDIRFFVSLDKAQTYRISGKLNASITLLDDILSWVGTDEYDYTNRIRCLTQIESDVLNGFISPDDVEIAIQSCTPVSYRMANTNLPTEISSNKDENELANVYPNPANDYITVTVSNNEINNIQIVDVLGKTLITEIFTNKADILISELKSGIYLYKITNETGNVQTGKLTKQ